MALLPPVVALLTADVTQFKAKMAEAQGQMDSTALAGSSSMSSLASVGKVALIGIATGAVAVGAVSIKMAADFQKSMTTLVTGAGESEKNIKMVGQGILDMAATVGQTPKNLAAGMYLIESAGYHGAAGLTVLKAAAEGAATGNAQMATVAGAVTTAMKDYSIPVGRANSVTSALIETVASGKTNLQDLGSSLGKVMPTAAALGINFQTVTGAMATMTNAGLSARFAAAHLNSTLLAMSAPSGVAVKAMQSVGLSADQVKQSLDTKGLGATLTMVEDAVGKKFPAGSVAYVTAMKNVMGGTTGYSTALMLSGKHTKEFADNVKNIGGVLNGSSTSVQGFAKVQKDVSFQVDQAKAALSTMAIEIGQHLLPILGQIVHIGADVLQFFAKHITLAIALGGAIGGVLLVAIGAYALAMASAAVSTVIAMAPIIAIIAGIGLLVGGFVLLYTHVAGFRDAVNTFVGLVKGAFADAISFAKQIVGDVTSWIKAHWTQIVDDAQIAWNIVSTFIKIAWQVISTIISVALAVIVPILEVAWSVIYNAVTIAWTLISTAIGTAITVIIAVVGTIVSIISFLTGVWQTVTSDVSGFIGGVVAFFTGLPGNITNAISGIYSTVGGFLKGVWNTITSDVGTAIGDVVTWFTKLPGKIKDAIGDAGTMLFNIGKNIITGLLNGIKSAMNDVKNFVSGIAGSIMSWKGPLDYDATILIPHGNAIMAGLVAGIQQGLNGPVKAALGQVTSAIAGTSFSPMSLGAGNLAVAGGGVAGAAGSAGGRQINIVYNIPVTGDMSPQTALYVKQQLLQHDQQLITTLNAL